MSKNAELQRLLLQAPALEAALAPCRVVIEAQNFGTRLGVGWKHPQGGMHALTVKAKPGASADVREMIEDRRAEFVAIAQWARVRATRWQQRTIWFRPKLRKALREKATALRVAMALDADRLKREAA